MERELGARCRGDPSSEISEERPGRNVGGFVQPAHLVGCEEKEGSETMIPVWKETPASTKTAGEGQENRGTRVVIPKKTTRLTGFRGKGS